MNRQPSRDGVSDPSPPDEPVADSSVAEPRDPTPGRTDSSAEHSRARDFPEPDSGKEPETPAELLTRARRYAREVPIDVDPARIEWEISRRAKRRAGACLFRPDSEEITIRLTWAAYEAFGWERFTATIRHELIHALEYRERGESGHGEFFRRWAAKLDAPRHCPRFSRPAYWIRCTDCGHRSARYRRSRVVDEPERYRCGSCEGPLTVEEVEPRGDVDSEGEVDPGAGD